MTKYLKTNWKSILFITIILLLALVAYQAEQPGYREPNPDWIASVSGSDIIRERVMFFSGNLQLEGGLILPVGGDDQKPAVVFVVGSGDSLYQAYPDGLLEKYLQGVFLPRDIAIFYYNKRGMGESGGTWLNNDIEGRAKDTYAAVEYLKTRPEIDPDMIGLAGHSQGGWVVTQTASEHDDIAFFISLAGPTTSVEGNMLDNYRGSFTCSGFKGEELERKISNQLKLTRLGAAIGKVLPFGIIGFDTHIIDYDPDEAIQSVAMPGLFVFGEHDYVVFAQNNSERFYEIFNGSPPDNLTVSEIPGANHIFRVTDSFCTSRTESLSQPLSEDLVEVLEDWLTMIGY